MSKNKVVKEKSNNIVVIVTKIFQNMKKNKLSEYRKNTIK